MALALVVCKTSSSLLVVTFMARKGRAEMGIGQPLISCVYTDGMCHQTGGFQYLVAAETLRP
jgi:hypothetical protein